MNVSEQVTALLAEFEREPGQRRQVRAQLVALGEPAVAPLNDVIQVGKGVQAWAAAQVLGELADPRAFRPLVGALRSDNPLLSGAAVAALLEYEGEDLVPHMLEALPHAHLMTQQSIVIALRRLGDPAAVPVLIRQLDETGSPTLRCVIIQALGELDAAEAIPSIRAYADDANHHVRQWVATVLEQLGAEDEADR